MKFYEIKWEIYENLSKLVKFNEQFIKNIENQWNLAKSNKNLIKINANLLNIINN